MPKPNSLRIAKVLCCSLLIFSHSEIKSQNNGDYRTIQNSNWSDIAAWQIYTAGSWISASTPPNQLSGKISIRNNLSVIVDQVIDQVIVDTGASITIQAGVTVTITNSPDAIDLNVKGTITNSGMLFFSPSAIMKVDSGGTYIHNSSVASSAVLDATQLHSESNWIYRGNGSLSPPVSLSNRHYGNLIFETSVGNWNRTITGSGAASCTSLRVDTQIILINNYTGLLSIHGSLTLYGALANGIGTQKFLLDGLDANLIGNNLSDFFDQLSIQSTGNYSLQNDMRVSPSSLMTVNGILNCNTFTLQGNNNGGSFVLNANARLNTAHPLGVQGSIETFSNLNFSNDANYEYSGITLQHDGFYNKQIKNLTLNGSATTLLQLKSDTIRISGTLSIIEGIVDLDSACVVFSGGPIAGQSSNLLSTEFSSIHFTGNADSIFIPGSIQTLHSLLVNKSMHHVTLSNDLIIKSILSLQKGNLICESNELFVGGNILGGSDSSFIQGSLSRNIPQSNAQNYYFPVGENFFHPMTIENMNCNSDTKLKAGVYESSPAGTEDGISLQGIMADRYYQLQVIGNNGITFIDHITMKPDLVYPPLSSSSKIGFSSNNSSNSFHGIGGSFNAGSISSTQPLSSCQLNDLSSDDGSFIGFAEEGSQGGIYTDSTCHSLLHIKVYIQGFYTGNGEMTATIDAIQFPSLCDTILVELHSGTFPFEMNYSFLSILDTEGTINLDKSGIPVQEFYIVLKHRNCLETWSSLPVNFSGLNTFYDFSVLNSSFGNNMIELEAGVFALYSGNLSQTDSLNQLNKDGKIDEGDLVQLEEAMMQFTCGYIESDLTGDGVTDLSDYSLMENNVQLNLEVIRPF